MKYKAFIRVVKSIRDDAEGYNGFGSINIVTEKLIEAEDKKGVKKYLLDKYPQFFPTNKVYEKETKDKAQFFYVVIYPLYNYEIEQLDKSWKCEYCGQEYSNTYENKPFQKDRLYKDLKFCRSEENHCFESYKNDKNKGIEMPDDEHFIKENSPNSIYKITEKSTNKCYIGKTRNAPFFRWWNHLTHSCSPFGSYLRGTKLTDWTFEVIEELPSDIDDSEVFKIETSYMHKFDSINNGFNKVVSSK